MQLFNCFLSRLLAINLNEAVTSRLLCVRAPYDFNRSNSSNFCVFEEILQLDFRRFEVQILDENLSLLLLSDVLICLGVFNLGVFNRLCLDESSGSHLEVDRRQVVHLMVRKIFKRRLSLGRVRVFCDR